MRMRLLVWRSGVPVSARDLFGWHERTMAFERLTPAWEKVKVREQDGGIRDGARVVLQIPFGPFSTEWEVRHEGYVADRQFVDRQIRGPFAFWKHSHLVEAVSAKESVLEDRIEYALPFGAIGDFFGSGMVRRKLERLFLYRHAVTVDDLAAFDQYRSTSSMKVLISGSTGLVGSTVCQLLSGSGHEITRLVRESPRSRQPEITWNPAKGELDAAKLEGFDAVVHLAGENISAGRWTEKQKARILESRVQGTRLLCETLAKLKNKPQVLVAASAIGYYGDRGATELDETSSPGSDMFLVDVCRQWEAATEPARAAGIRVVNLRLGVVLSPNGGALAKMLLPFKLGAGGVIGNGEQYMSWIAIDDAAGAIQHAIATTTLSGPVNGTAPGAVTNRVFTKTLGKVLRRPTIFPMPAFAARLAFGQMADELLLASTRVVPKKLEETGYRFRYAELEGALRHVLGV